MGSERIHNGLFDWCRADDSTRICRALDRGARLGAAFHAASCPPSTGSSSWDRRSGKDRRLGPQLRRLQRLALITQTEMPAAVCSAGPSTSGLWGPERRGRYIVAWVVRSGQATRGKPLGTRRLHREFVAVLPGPSDSLSGDGDPGAHAGERDLQRRRLGQRVELRNQRRRPLARQLVSGDGPNSCLVRRALEIRERRQCLSDSGSRLMGVRAEDQYVLAAISQPPSGRAL